MGAQPATGTFPPARAARLASALLNRHSAGEIGQAIDIMIDVLAMLEPPTEDEPDFRTVSDGKAGDAADTELDGTDHGDVAWIEWHTMRGNMKSGPNILAGREDDEDSDAAEEDDECGQCDEDGINTHAQGLQSGARHGPGCVISDVGGCEHDGSEREQMLGDVPAPHVYSLAYNPFTDQRTLLAAPGPGGSVYFKVGEQMWKGEPMPKGPIALARPSVP